MSFFDFLIKYWWIEILAVAGIGYGAYLGYIENGTALLFFVASVLLFWGLSRTGLE